MTRPVPIGRKVVVYGPSGSGKSTVGEGLARKLGLPWIELDAIYHAGPGWQDLDTAVFRDEVRTRLESMPHGWVMDGNYHVAMEECRSSAQTIVWLDLPFHVVYRRLARRTVGRALRGTELWNGNRETVRQTFLSRDSMLWWGIHAWRWSKARTRNAVAARAPGTRVYRLRTTGQVRYLLDHAELTTPDADSGGLPSTPHEEDEPDANLPRR